MKLKNSQPVIAMNASLVMFPGLLAFELSLPLGQFWGVLEVVEVVGVSRLNAVLQDPLSRFQRDWKQIKRRNWLPKPPSCYSGHLRQFPGHLLICFLFLRLSQQLIIKHQSSSLSIQFQVQIKNMELPLEDQDKHDIRVFIYLKICFIEYKTCFIH